MEPEKLAQWQAADALFDQWLDQPEAGRDAWLATQAPPDAVRRLLDQLIAAHRRPSAALEPAGGDLAGRRLGEWTLAEELGRGGMAVVYRAWRDSGAARQQAAVKVLTLGALGAAGRERFHREAAILARLNHPNAAALIDSGVADDGTCWLAMPLVEGERIDRWCEARGADARAIVRLSLQVCAAVAYAHRNLVIHRDLKPSNVLVDASGHVRLLDFGIGQFSDAEADRTQTMWRALTPGYAAPEQLRGDPPGTAMDVYGLGALLHRLLTGRLPQAGAGGDATTRPSLLVRDAGDAYHRHYVPLRNDLDRVLLKALAEEPEQRYATADALADDLRRWLDGLPVLAQKPRPGYRLRKFVSRNRAGVAAGVLLAASLAGGVAATLWQAGEARREAGNATVQAQRALLVRDFLAHVFESTEPASGGVPTALELLDEGARRARSSVLRSDPLAAADILALTGKARIELDDLDKALADLTQAAALLASDSMATHADRSRVEADLSRAMRLGGHVEAALRHARAAVDAGELALAREDAVAVRLDAGIVLGEALAGTDPEASLAEFEHVVQTILQSGLQDTVLHLDALNGLSLMAFAVNPEDVETHVRLSEEVIRLSSIVEGPGSGWHAESLSNQLTVFAHAGQTVRADQIAAEAVTLADRIFRQPHSTKATVYCNVAVHFHTTGRIADALPYYAVADRINAGLPHAAADVESCFRLSGHAHLSAGELDRAVDSLEQSWQILQRLDRQDSRHGHYTCGHLASAHIRLGALQAAARQLDHCPPGEAATGAFHPLQAEAELRFAQGDYRESSRLASGLRVRNPPEPRASRWMRPWMLSFLLAERGGVENRAELLAALGEAAATRPLADCLARPDEGSCLAVP